MRHRLTARRIALAGAMIAGLGAAAPWAATRAADPVPAPESADSSARARRVTPWSVAIATDQRTVRVGLDGALRWAPLERTTDRREMVQMPPGRGPFALELGLGARQQTGESGPRAALRTSLRATFDLAAREAWFGVASGDPLAGGSEPARIHLGGGLSSREGPLEVETALISSSVSIPGGLTRRTLHTTNPRGLDSTYFSDPERAPEHHALWATGQATLRLSRGRAEIATIAGITLGAFTRPQRWMQAALHLRLAPSVSLALSTGRRAPGSLAFDPGAAPRTMIGLEFVPVSRPALGPAAGRVPEYRPATRHWRTSPLGGGRVALDVECPNATRLELRGDFTEWEPVTLRRIGGGWWELVSRIDPGLHFIEIRMDGGSWIAPPGLPLNAAGAGAPSGTLLVE